MSKIRSICVLLSFSVLLSACGGGGGGGSSSTAASATTDAPIKKIFELDYFDVVSNSDTVLTDTVTEVNSGFNQGAFSLEWAGQVQEAGTGAKFYNVNAWISSDTELSPSQDIRIISTVCNTDYFDGKMQHCGGNEWVMSCVLHPEYYQVSCGSDNDGILTTMPLPVTQVPQQLNVIFQFCDRHQEECIVKIKPIVVY